MRSFHSYPSPHRATTKSLSSTLLRVFLQTYAGGYGLTTWDSSWEGGARTLDFVVERELGYYKCMDRTSRTKRVSVLPPSRTASKIVLFRQYGHLLLSLQKEADGQEHKIVPGPEPVTTLRFYVDSEGLPLPCIFKCYSGNIVICPEASSRNKNSIQFR